MRPWEAAPGLHFLARHFSWPPFQRRPPGGGDGPGPLGRRLAWFIGLWLASVICLALISLAIKAMIGS